MAGPLISIHPFLDGNGRLGRLLITLLLCEQKVLRQPMLFPSLYFKTHRQHYYQDKELVDSGDIFHLLAWTPAEAYRLLKSVPLLEESGLLVRLPDWWRKRLAPGWP